MTNRVDILGLVPSTVERVLWEKVCVSVGVGSKVKKTFLIENTNSSMLVPNDGSVMIGGGGEATLESKVHTSGFKGKKKHFSQKFDFRDLDVRKRVLRVKKRFFAKFRL